jgi:hypothetical protein
LEKRRFGADNAIIVHPHLPHAFLTRDKRLLAGIGDLELNRTACLLLLHHATRANALPNRHITDPKFDQIAATKFAIEPDVSSFFIFLNLTDSRLRAGLPANEIQSITIIMATRFVQSPDGR